MERISSSVTAPAKPVPQYAVLLREFRLGAGLTQDELSNRSGVSVRAISDLERGSKTRPQQATVQLLAGGLGLTATQRSELEASVPTGFDRPARCRRPSIYRSAAFWDRCRKAR